MLGITYGPTARKFISTGEGTINEVGGGNVVPSGYLDDTANVIGNIASLVSKTDFLTPKARLTLAKLRQAFSSISIFHHFDLECHI